MVRCVTRSCGVRVRERPSAAWTGYRCVHLMKPGTKLERKLAPVATHAEATTGDGGWERGGYRLEFRPALWLLIRSRGRESLVGAAKP